jgi:oligopeptidase A
MDMTNPLLNIFSLPRFDLFHVEHVEPAIDYLLQESQRSVDNLVGSSLAPTWQNFIEPLESLDNSMERIWGSVSHLDAVKNSDEWHEVYAKCLEKVTSYSTNLGQNTGLFKKYKQLEQGKEYQEYCAAQKKVIENSLRNFRLSGIDLPEQQQQEFKAISLQLSQLTTAFANNILKSTQAWTKNITNVDNLAGIPETSLAMLKQLAEQKNLDGWLVTLDFPSYLAVITYAENRELRAEVYQAFATRSSERANNPEFDNSDNIKQILKLRHQKALLLGFANYAELSLATKMVDTIEQVMSFILDLVERSREQAKQELATLKTFAKQKLLGGGRQDAKLEPWDISFYAEQLKNETLNISQEKLRPYFPVKQCLDGMFTITKILFGVEVRERQGVNVWHEDVRFFDLFNNKNELIASFYLDLFARENKRGGAWMDTVATRWQPSTASLQLPVAYLVCNFTPAVSGKTACLTHNEVTTLFHEFGHGLHHMLTEMVHFEVSGINGVPWDAVELPSQFMENFCWTREGVDLISAHIKTGEVLPDELLQSLQKSRGFQSAMMMLHQLEFSLFDMSAHASYQPDDPQPVLEVSQQIREQVAVIFPPEYNRFPHSFSHIFAGGYAAGYFSYKWAEVLSTDAFSLFEEQGILNQLVGAKFKNTILAKGGSKHPIELFKTFRGREPNVDALLKYSYIV